VTLEQITRFGDRQGGLYTTEFGALLSRRVAEGVELGVGYRYAGHGIWLDGFRDNALLNFGKHSQVACTIVRS